MTLPHLTLSEDKLNRVTKSIEDITTTSPPRIKINKRAIDVSPMYNEIHRPEMDVA